MNKLARIPVTVPFAKQGSGGDRAKHILKESVLKRMENVDILGNPLAYYSLFRVTLKDELARAKERLESSEQDTSSMEKASADLEKAISAVFNQHNLTFFAKKQHQIQGCSPYFLGKLLTWRVMGPDFLGRSVFSGFCFFVRIW